VSGLREGNRVRVHLAFAFNRRKPSSGNVGTVVFVDREFIVVDVDGYAMPFTWSRKLTERMIQRGDLKVMSAVDCLAHLVEREV
jgi:hypothetical protein